jgi:hypothetical protein
MNSKLEQIRKEMAVNGFYVLTRHITGEPEENHITTAGVLALLLELAFSVINIELMLVSLTIPGPICKS